MYGKGIQHEHKRVFKARASLLLAEKKPNFHFDAWLVLRFDVYRRMAVSNLLGGTMSKRDELAEQESLWAVVCNCDPGHYLYGTQPCWFHMNETERFKTAFKAGWDARDARDDEVNRLREALKFYANQNNWEVSVLDDLVTVKTKLTKDKEAFGESEQPGLASKLTYYGGRIARQALAETESGE